MKLARCRAKKRSEPHRVVLAIQRTDDPRSPTALYELRAVEPMRSTLLHMLPELRHKIGGNGATHGRGKNGSLLSNGKPSRAPPVRPHYDPASRTLFLAGRTLKRFRVPARNQELILQTAQELRWAQWFDDPLPRGNCRNPKVRLHNTIRDLNRNQKPYLIHFKGDGTGTRIGWEIRRK